MPDIQQRVRAAMADPNYPAGEPDPVAWAVAFIQAGQMATPLGRALRAFPDGKAQDQLVEAMVGWFANAMASAPARADPPQGAGQSARDHRFVVENTGGTRVATFATHFLADQFVKAGRGAYRHRVADPAANGEATN